ncbi:MAG: NAD(P)H-hydrate epimerase, partial [Gammaproteobacteria bacterium]|nr:NAD(P)H-hydrate epimerase [Gammaproteobacteria bacterium]
MSVLPTALYRAAQVRELDRLAGAQVRTPGNTLMERAGAAAWKILVELWPGARSVTIVCGGGNNGGDGYVLARLAHEQGFRVQVIAVAAPQTLRGDARTAADRWLASACGVHASFPPEARSADVVVDALLGTGLDRPVEGEPAGAVAWMNECQGRILSLDIPSGLHADTGQAMGACVRATATVTFIGLKPGLFTGAGPGHAGRILFAGLDVPPEIYSGIRPACYRIDYQSQKHCLGERRRDAHKGDFGHVLVAGGDYGFPGSVRLAAEAAARVGSGLV